MKPEIAFAAHTSSLAPSMAPCLAPLAAVRHGLTGQTNSGQRLGGEPRWSVKSKSAQLQTNC
jgi:hypothetical protein